MALVAFKCCQDIDIKIAVIDGLLVQTWLGNMRFACGKHAKITNL